jgi:hypothetical protein
LSAGSPPQYFGFALRVNDCALKSPSWNGPVPTGFGFTSVAGAA